MPISIACSECRYEFKVKDDFAGRKGKCPKCSAIFLAPGGKAPAATRKVAAKSTQKSSPKTRVPAAQSSSRAAPTKKAGSGKKRKVATATAVGKPAPKAVKVQSVALPTGQAVARTPSASTSSTYRRRRRSAAPIWIWILMAGGAIVAIGGWGMFATGILGPKKNQEVAKKDKQQQTATKAGVDGKAEEKKDEETAPPSTEESDSAEKEKTSDDDDKKKPSGPTKTEGNESPQPSAPEKPAEPPLSKNPTVTAEQIDKLAAACREFQWQPKSKAHYAQMAECALRMNQALSDTATDESVAAATRVFEELAVLKWNANDIRAVNRFAAERIDEVGAGAFLLVEVKSTRPGKAFSQLIETDKMVIIEYDSSQAQAKPEAKWLILGVNSPKETKISFDPEGKISQTVRNVEQMFLVTIAIQTKAERFGPDR